MGIAIMAIFVSGCKKEYYTESPAKNDATILLLKSYTDSVKKVYKTDVQLKKHRWLRILGKDLLGALSGAYTGSQIGSSVPGLGTGVGAAIGAVVGGAGASLVEAGKEDKPAAGNQGGAIVVHNAQNPYEYVANLHYEIIKDIAEDSLIVYKNGKFIFNSYYNYVISKMRNIFDNDNLKYFREDIFKNVSNFVDNYNHDLLFFVNDNETPYYNKITPEERIILNLYYELFEIAPNYETFAMISIGFENIINNSIYLDEKTKAVLLTNMATARVGIAYWY